MIKISKKILIISFTVIALILTLTGCSQEADKPVTEASQEISAISTEDLVQSLDDPSYVIIDTRSTDAYNGWKLGDASRGGHIKGAVDFPASWLDQEVENKEEILSQALLSKEIAEDKSIVLYDDNDADALKVAEYLKGKGYEKLYTYDVKQWAKDESLEMEKYPNYQLIVPASIVKDIIDGKKPESFENAKNIKIVEASWGEEETSYANGHVPTAFHINTDIVEPPPAWMLASDDELAKFASDFGFTKDDTVIVTSQDQMAAYRVAEVLRYIGVSDVRVLNGGLKAWTDAGYELETASIQPQPASDFGAVIPANPDEIMTIEELKANLDKPGFTLVDNRTWEEYIGESSGYSYHDKAGRIPGAVFGYAGLGDATSLDHYRNIDNTMRNAAEIKALWEKSGIDMDNELAFMCGSGWRAAEVKYYADVMGLTKTSLYSDGWIGWSNAGNESETGEPQ